jgi:hypothetical protein
VCSVSVKTLCVVHSLWFCKTSAFTEAREERSSMNRLHSTSNSSYYMYFSTRTFPHFLLQSSSPSARWDVDKDNRVITSLSDKRVGLADILQSGLQENTALPVSRNGSRYLHQPWDFFPCLQYRNRMKKETKGKQARICLSC